MTSDEFSDLALGLGPNVRAKAILDSIQFQVGGATFATLGWPEQGWAVVKVDPRRQAWALSLSRGLTPEPGRRRNAGIVLARLTDLDAGVFADLLADAWRHGQGGARRAAGEPATAVLAVS
jgi:hypothetical protein